MSKKKIILTGHRGAAGLAPENTLASIELALDLGVDRVEIDVHKTIDDELVVIHDRTLKRTTNGFGYIKRNSFDYIRSLSAGIKFDSYYYKEKVPKLSEVIELVRDSGKELVIENKYSYLYYHNIERKIVNVIRDMKAQNFCKIISFNDKTLFRLYNLAPEFRYGKLFYTKHAVLPVSFDVGINIKPLNRYDFVEEIILQYKFINESIVNKIHDFNKQVHVWTVNDKEVIGVLLDCNVDGIFTDYPNIVKSKVKQYNKVVKRRAR